uniref:Reverse transcriptase/retrotransposon-derived protein RNase H-like domain-containing protein n=1 Tax=Romanomermis culicivorax TaxID=13658 RepID=A0A915ICX8_ROMCU
MVYTSLKLTKPETGHSTTERECLVIVYSFQMYGHYLFGSKVQKANNAIRFCDLIEEHKA